MSEIEKVYEDEDFSVIKEEAYGVCFYHCYVDNFSKSVLERMLEVWEDVKTVAHREGWPQIHSYTRNPKFAMMLPGAEKVNSFHANGEDYEVIRWDLE